MSDFIKLFEDETVSTIEALLGQAPALTLKEEQDLTILSNIIPPVSLININVSGNVAGNIIFAALPTLITGMSDMMIGEEASSREDVREEDLDAIKEIVSNIFGAIGNTLSAQKELPILSFKIEDIEFVNEEEVSLEKFGLNPNHKTVLYAPSFYPSSLDKLESILGKVSFEINIIIKLHNFSWYQERYIYQSEKMQKLANEFPNIYLAPPEEYNIIPYYSASDLLLSDISSTMFEYLYLNRPIIMAECITLRLKHQILKKRFLKKMDVERMENIDFSFRFDNPDDLPALVYHGLEYPSDLESERLIAQKEYLFKVDGQASIRLVDAIETKLTGKSH
jgi:chemotaxis protein CheY-P-specific phosphatase CheC